MIHLNDVALRLGHKEIFSGLSWHIKSGHRYALIGRNGAGKTTLFRLLTDQQEIDKGSVLKRGKLKIGYLPQEQTTEFQGTVLAATLAPFEHLKQMAQEIEALEQDLSSDQKLNRYTALQEQFEAAGGDDLELRAKKILSGMGFSQKDLIRPITEFSGGWRMRVYLGRLLLDQPDLLLLDEPTNHLDLPSMIWLEQHLNQINAGLILISHDRTFINRLATDIASLDRGEIITYKGNYDDFVTQKAQREALILKQYEQQQEEIAGLKRFIDRFKAKASKAAQARGKEKQLEKILANPVKLPATQQQFSFNLPLSVKGGKIALTGKNIEKRFGDLTIMKESDLLVERGERIAIVGRNGIGKTTLLRMIAGLTEYRGELQTGHEVYYSYFGQHQIDELNLSHDLQTEVTHYADFEDIPNIRTFLGCFMFTGEDVHQKIGTLSGGEKSRVALVKMLLKRGNLLLLDEPTNHLDFEAKEILLNALERYEGTILFVSHDRDFIARLATSVISIEDQKLVKYIGGYDYYCEKQSEESGVISSSGVTAPGKVSRARLNKQERAKLVQERATRLRPLKKQLETVEKKIEASELKHEKLLKLISDPEFYEKTPSDQLNETLKEMKRSETTLEELTDIWESCSMEIEEIEEEYDL